MEEGVWISYSSTDTKVGLETGSPHSHNGRVGCGALLYTFHLSGALSIQGKDGGWCKAHGDPHESAQRQCHLKSSRFCCYVSPEDSSQDLKILSDLKICQVPGDCSVELQEKVGKVGFRNINCLEPE